jgi:hypothetical protein
MRLVLVVVISGVRKRRARTLGIEGSSIQHLTFFFLIPTRLSANPVVNVLLVQETNIRNFQR